MMAVRTLGILPALSSTILHAQSGPAPATTADVYAVAGVLDQLTSIAADAHSELTETRSQLDAAEAAAAAAETAASSGLPLPPPPLNTSLGQTKEALLGRLVDATAEAVVETQKFAATARELYGGDAGLRTCADARERLSCGQHAGCLEKYTLAGKRAKCVCEQGYIGDGFDCRPPAFYVPAQVAALAGRGDSSVVSVVRACAAGGSAVAVSASALGALQATVARVSPANIDWANDALSITVAASAPNAMAVGCAGAGVAAVAAESGGRMYVQLLKTGDLAIDPAAAPRLTRAGAPVLLGDAVPGERPAVIAAGDGAVAILYAAAGGAGKVAVFLANSTAPQQFEFYPGAVQAVEAVSLDARRFVVSFRGGPSDRAPSGVASAALVCAFTERKSVACVPHELDLAGGEPVAARSLALVSRGVLSYVGEGAITGVGVSLVRFVSGQSDGSSAPLAVLQQRPLFAGGESVVPYLAQTSLPAAPGPPAVVVLFADPATGNPQVKRCSVTAGERLGVCSTSSWLEKSVSSVAVFAVGEARVGVVYVQDGVVSSKIVRVGGE